MTEQDNIVPPQSQHLLIVDKKQKLFRLSRTESGNDSSHYIVAGIREKPREGEKGSRKGKGSLLPQLPMNVDHTFSRSPLPLKRDHKPPKQDLASCPQTPKKPGPSTFEALFTPPPRMPWQPIQPVLMSLDVQARSVTSVSDCSTRLVEIDIGADRDEATVRHQDLHVGWRPSYLHKIRYPGKWLLINTYTAFISGLGTSEEVNIGRVIVVLAYVIDIMVFIEDLPAKMVPRNFLVTAMLSPRHSYHTLADTSKHP
ncbi:hypothetical protein BU17DRAFT_62614 [Hysterangium stoloniferum]|nr:hypothetical protein BU17DRAFT_62614 [Hysterangium stoloniferum]